MPNFYCAHLFAYNQVIDELYNVIWKLISYQDKKGCFLNKNGKQIWYRNEKNYGKSVLKSPQVFSDCEKVNKFSV